MHSRYLALSLTPLIHLSSLKNISVNSMQSYNHDNETKLNFKMKGMGFFYYNVETELNQLVISNMLTNQKHKPIRQNSMLKSWNVNT